MTSIGEVRKFELTNQITDAETIGSVGKGVYKVGAVSALILLVLFLIGSIGIITNINGWFTPFVNNWLVVLFKLNAGFSGIQTDLLNVLNLLDIAIMPLFCTMFLALYVALKRTSRIWSLIATALPFLGIPVFLITGTAGRSTLLIGGLIISVVMLRSKIFSKPTAYVGIVASVLLFFAGDIATAAFSSSNIIALFIAAGYVLWMIWFSLIARRLFQLR